MKIILRFFDVNCSNRLTSSSSLVNRVIGKLSSVASDRMMPVNKTSSDKFDLISNYLKFDNGKAITGTYLRITNSKGVPVINEEMLRQTQFSLSSINENAKTEEKTCLDYFYFCLSNEYLIIALDKRGSLTRFETYINWLLNTSESGENISFTPVIDESKMSIADIKKITIGKTCNISVPDSQEKQVPSIASKVIGIAGEVLKSIVSDTSGLDELMDSNICSADLIIKFSKPRSMSKDEYKKKTAGVILKSLEDPEGIKFSSKAKQTSGSQILKSEDIDVECDTNGALSEQNVYQKMFKSLNGLMTKS